MTIESLYIGSFGGKTGFTFEPGEGVTVAEGENESGKSTIVSFIKFMLYGFSSKAERMLCRNAADDCAEGTVTVSTGKGRFRIERRDCGAKQSVKIVELTGNTVVCEGREPGEFFFGVPAEVFEHTALLRQLGNGSVNGKQVAAAAENILFSADETVNMQKALKKLDDARIALLHKNRKGGAIFECENELDALGTRLRRAGESNSAIISLQGSIAEDRKSLATAIKKRDELHTALDKYTVLVFRGRRNRLAEAEAELASAEAALRELDTELPEGFTADSEYLNSLKKAEAGKKYLKERHASVTADIEATRISEAEECERLEREYGESLAGRVAQAGGREALRTRLGLLLKSRKTLMAFAIIMLILAVPSAAGGFLLLSLSGVGTAMLLFGFSLVLLAGAVLLAAGASRRRRGAEALARSLGLGSAGELEAALDSDASGKPAPVLTSRIPALEDEAARITDEKTALEAALVKLARRAGADTSDAAARLCEDYIRRHGECEAEISRCRAIRDSARASLEEMGETEDDGLPISLPEGFVSREAKRGYDFLSKSADALSARIHDNEIKLAGLTSTVESPSAISERITSLEHKLAEMRLRHSALVLACEKLEEASLGLRDGLAPRLSRRAGEYMDQLTDGRYRRIGVSADFSLSFELNGEGGLGTYGIDYMSAGTGAVAYISLRLALIELLFHGEKPPVIFDEIFAGLDGDRMMLMMRLLDAAAGNGLQSLVFTANGRETAAAVLLDSSRIKTLQLPPKIKTNV